jgi:cell wall-associated NlpC family hydrolase
MSGGRGISTPAVALAAAGGVAVYAAMKGVGFASGTRALLSGQPLPAGDSLLIDTSADVHAGRGLGSDSAIVAAATRYMNAGHVYRWGGGSPDGWDCSGFTNWVLCHDLGLAIPGYGGGTFTGRAHGPVTMQWAVWSGAAGIPRAEVGAGDLVIWPTQHMGIAVDNQQMINAPGPNGTPAPVLSHIDGSARGLLVCRRLSGR